MGYYRQKPIVVQAVKWNGSAIGFTNGDDAGAQPVSWVPAISKDMSADRYPGSPGFNEVWRDGEDLFIGAHGGVARCVPGDWIICGMNGELHGCTSDAFAASYEAATEQ